MLTYELLKLGITRADLDDAVRSLIRMFAVDAADMFPLA